MTIIEKAWWLALSRVPVCISLYMQMQFMSFQRFFGNKFDGVLPIHIELLYMGLQYGNAIRTPAKITLSAKAPVKA